MKKVFLINRKRIPHYRVPVYNYLSNYLKNNEFVLTVVSEGLEQGNPHPNLFVHKGLHLCFMNLARLLIHEKPDVVIFWVNPELYTFPILFLSKSLKIKVIHWGHRRDLQHPNAFIKNFVYALEHWIDDAIILYAEHLKKYIDNRFQSKIFIANNTLNLKTYNRVSRPKDYIRNKYGIITSQNIICIGRMHKRKRIEDLVSAFRLLKVRDVGLILVGPDPEGILSNIKDANIFKLGPVYGEESLDLLSFSEVYCLPGAIGLSIVDAFYCGLPVITEDVNHGAEIMYLKDGINGYMVPKGDICQLATKLETLLLNDDLRKRFSKAAKRQIHSAGDIDTMCAGFLKALQYVCQK